jgi:hypothetical protein
MVTYQQTVCQLSDYGQLALFGRRVWQASIWSRWLRAYCKAWA